MLCAFTSSSYSFPLARLCHHRGSQRELLSKQALMLHHETSPTHTHSPPFHLPSCAYPHLQRNSYDSPNRRRQTLSLPHHAVACNNLRTASLPLNYTTSMPSGHTTYPLHHHHMLRPTKSTRVKGLVFLLWPTSPLVT